MYKFLVLLTIIKFIDSNPVKEGLDWRTKGAVLPVTDQGGCGHASVLNALDAISAMHQINGEKLVKLSQQQVYDCSVNYCPCGYAGNVSEVYQQLWSESLNSWIDSEESYPSTGQCTHKCNFKQSGAVTQLIAYTFSGKPNMELDLYTLLNSGPVTVEVRADTTAFLEYTKGILDDPNCTGDVLNHVLLLVGYGTQNGKDYWIARNSWGTNWGENGYIRIVRDKNMCGIGNYYVKPFMYPKRNQSY